MKTLFLLLYLSAVQPAFAENLLTNGGFDSNLDGWTIGYYESAISWSSLDEFNQSNSGSLLMEEKGEFGPLLEQCTNIDPALIPSFSVRHFVPESVTTPYGFVVIGIKGFSVANCGGSTLYSESSVFSNDSVHKWRSIAVKGEAGASAVEVSIYVVGPATMNYVAHFDNAYLGDKQFEDGFESPPDN